MYEGPLQPLEKPLGVLNQYIAHQPTILIMKGDFSFSGSDYVVSTVDGQQLLQSEGKAMSFSRRVEFRDNAGQHLFTLRRKPFALLAKFYLEDSTQNMFLEITKKWSFMSTKMDIHFKNTLGQGEDVKLELAGSWTDRKVDISWNGQPIVKVRREFISARNFFGAPRTYGIEVAPGIDMAVMAAIVLSVDEAHRAKNNS